MKVLSSSIDIVDALDWKLKEGQTLRQAMVIEVRKELNIPDNTIVEVVYTGDDWPLKVYVTE